MNYFLKIGGYFRWVLFTRIHLDVVKY